MSRTTGRHFLQIPGPSNVPDEVLRAMSAPTIDHRGPDFAELGRAVLDGLGPVFGTTNPVVVYPSSGTGAWEAALVNTLSPGDRVLSFETGHFAMLWQAMAGALGLEVDLVPGDWRHGVDPDVVEERLAADSGHAIKAVCVVHNETSTGVTSRVAEVRAAMDRAGHPALLLVDTISSLGSIDYRHDEWGVDVTVSGLAEGPDAPARAGLQRGQRQGARGVPHRRAQALLLGLGADPRGQPARLLALHARHQPALRPPRVARGCSTRRGCRRSSRATSATPRPPAPPCAAGAWRSSAPTSASTPAC